MSDATLYERYGGFAKVSALVHTFYERVLATPRLQHYFDGVSMDGLIAHQTKFLCQILGGPCRVYGQGARSCTQGPLDHSRGLRHGCRDPA